MSITRKKNAVSSIQAHVSASDMFNVAMKAARVASNAGLSFVSAGIAYYLVACHLQEDEKKRETVKDARSKMEKHIEANADIGDRMLQRYLQTIGAGFRKLTDGNKFPLVVQRAAKIEKADELAEYLETVFRKEWSCASMNDLLRKFGIKKPDRNATPTPLVDRVTDAVTRATAVMVKTNVEGAMTPKEVAKAAPKVGNAIAQATPHVALIDTIEAALRRLAELDNINPADVARLAKLATTVVSTLQSKAKLKASAAKADAKTVVAAKANTKAAQKALRGKGWAKSAEVTAH